MPQHDAEQGDMMEHEDGFTGEATVVVDGTELGVTVALRGHFQPIDGYYHWYGRIDENAELSALLDGRKRTALLRTPEGEASGSVSDPDPWNRYRIHGTSTPPFTVPTSLNDI